MKKSPIFQTGAVAQAWSTAPIQRQPNLGPRILVVGDDLLILRLNSEVLSYVGYQVDAVNDAAAAWEALLVNDYDLMITDNDMPRVTGVNLLMKVHSTRMAMPVVMATGTLPAEKFAQFPGLKPTAVVIKPYTLDELLATVEDVLHATAAARAKISPPPSWQGKLATGDLRP